MSPPEYISARETQSKEEPYSSSVTVDGRPYFPHLHAPNPNDIPNKEEYYQSIVHIAATVIGYDRSLIDEIVSPANKTTTNLNSDEQQDQEEEEKKKQSTLQISIVSGGITNALFRVSGFSHPNSILVRVFGAEGMIDRDEETSTYVALCDANIAHQYLGRFGNGRIEGWLDHYRPLETIELSNVNVSNKIAHHMAKLHCGFVVPDYLRQYHNVENPGMWTQLCDWMEQSKSENVEYPYKVPNDETRASELFDLEFIEKELYQLKSGEKGGIPKQARVAFCHNDLLAANIMRSTTSSKDGDEEEEFDIQLIDFEYGGVNYACFDIANHFNEWAGGTTDGKPNYDLFPTIPQKTQFCQAYLTEVTRLQQNQNQRLQNEDETQSALLQTLMMEVDAFVLANHLYWGLWAVNQAKAEGCDDFDYLLYAHNRFRRFEICQA